MSASTTKITKMLEISVAEGITGRRISDVTPSKRMQQKALRRLAGRSPVFYLAVFTVWILTIFWFHPRLASLLDAATGPWTSASLVYFILFTEIAWLYGIYNISVVVFSAWLQRQAKRQPAVVEAVPPYSDTPVAVLYTTCNDFLEESAESCLAMRYPNFTLYLLDDSSNPACQRRVDDFATRHPDRTKVIRRTDRSGYKAGNLNHALQHLVTEPLFVIADADEILPVDFLEKLVPRLQHDPHCGFIQANHASKPWAKSQLEKDMGIGVDIHWKWYQPLRNHFGFVMFLGHGALLRRDCWQQVQGFPELVSEDLAYALAIREIGYYGKFAEDVLCYEEFPSSVRAFRIRHVKWTRGTCEFLGQWFMRLMRSRNISLTEKVDVLFPTLNLPLTLFYFFFMINAGLFLPLSLGYSQMLTLMMFDYEVAVPTVHMPKEIMVLFTLDFFLITIMTITAPVLCFIIEMWKQPLRLFRFLSHSTALYAALSPLSAICVVGYLLTRKARFLVTGDMGVQPSIITPKSNGNVLQRAWKFLCETHPDHPGVWILEIFCALVFIATALVGFQVSFLGLAIAFLLLPIMHFTGWSQPAIRVLQYLPFTIIMAGLGLGSMSMVGMQPVLFGFGFHF